MERERISLMEIITVNIPRPDILVHIDNVNIDILNLFRYGITTFVINGKNIGLQLYVVNINAYNNYIDTFIFIYIYMHGHLCICKK